LKFPILIVASLTASACNTFGRTTLTLVASDPPGALVRVEGFGECEAPCTVEIDRPRVITVAKAGYNPQRLTIAPGQRRVDVALELSAPTTGVEAEELPEL
jgi:hypothetical protein